ncbi:MAG: MFS transporter, partial [Lachnospiraceae bacterium]|nr:MFS transporter [Lachnospiraceae bacterium]
LSGILGAIGNSTALFIGLILLAMFMGASSNYTVSAAVQYWRIEDFPSVFSVVNPVANFINAFGPTIVAALIATALGTQAVFIVIGIAAIISIILGLLFKPARVKEFDDKYRAAAGKPLDDVLVGRK